jgi:putative membrane protein
MDLLIGTLVLRPYVFGFLIVFLTAGVADLGLRRTLLFAGWVWPLAWLAEAASTRTGIPFGLYHYTGTTRGQELYVADVPLMDSLSFTFLAYSAYCLARAALGRAAPSRTVTALLAGALMMALDVVIDPIAVRGDRWFLGRIFYYPDGGVYFGVPLSNFLGWVIVGTAGVGGFLAVAGPAGRRPWPGVALYYGVLGFNLFVTAWIGEWTLLGVGVVFHAATAVALVCLARRRGPRVRLEGPETQRI